LRPGAILLVSEAVDVDAEGVPISYALSRFPAERMELVV
jgi:GntR family phosphonate transport system transcriptional regulator